MLGLSFAAVPLYDLFCRVTGFGGTTQISKEAPKIVLDETISVRLDTNVNSQLDWKFESESNTMEVKPGKVYKIKFNVETLVVNRHQELQVTMCLLLLLVHILIKLVAFVLKSKR